MRLSLWRLFYLAVFLVCASWGDETGSAATSNQEQAAVVEPDNERLDVAETAASPVIAVATEPVAPEGGRRDEVRPGAFPEEVAGDEAAAESVQVESPVFPGVPEPVALERGRINEVRPADSPEELARAGELPSEIAEEPSPDSSAAASSLRGASDAEAVPLIGTEILDTQQHDQPGSVELPIPPAAVRGDADEDEEAEEDESKLPPCEPLPRRELSFIVCDDMATQRLSIAAAAVLAAETGRALRLPAFLVADGTQFEAAAAGGFRLRTAAEAGGGGGNALPFESVHSSAPLVAVLAARGITVLPPAAAPPAAPAAGAAAAPDAAEGAAAVVDVDLSDRPDALRELRRAPVQCAAHVSLVGACPAFRVPPPAVARHAGVVLDTLAALAAGLAPRLASLVRNAVAALGGPAAFDALHLRAEADWHAACA